MPDERRKQLRRNGFKTGSIFVGDGSEEVDCLIWNLSDFGAMVEVDNKIVLPTNFHLVAASLFIDRRCKMIWRDGRKLGVAFVL